VVDERLRLEVQERERRGSREARRLRREGLIPGVIYGGDGNGARAISVPERELRRVLTGSHGLHAILDVVLDGEKPRASILKDYQRDPVRGVLSHIDLMEVRLDRPIQASVAVELVGEPVGVREGGVLSQVTREITVEALPMEVPERLELDVSGMAIGDTLRLADLPPREGVTYLDDPDETVLANVTPPTVVVEPEVEEEEEAAEGVEGEEPEGEAAAAPEAEGEGTGSEGEPGTGPG
jgi:large subunit ribosomal protein L25